MTPNANNPAENTTDPAPAIRTHRLTKTYGKARGIVDLDLAIPHGEVFGYLGPNGAGKTTTIRLLLDFLRPTSGSAEVLGLDSRTKSVEIRRHVGYLPGELDLYSTMTGGELLTYFGNLRGGVDPARVEELARRLDLDLDRHIKNLSKGNKQKVGIVQAFMHEPQVLILDEPTSGLDPLVQLEFQAFVHEATARGSDRLSLLACTERGRGGCSPRRHSAGGQAGGRRGRPVAQVESDEITRDSLRAAGAPGHVLEHRQRGGSSR